MDLQSVATVMGVEVARKANCQDSGFSSSSRISTWELAEAEQSLTRVSISRRNDSYFFSRDGELYIHFSFSPWFSRLWRQNCPVGGRGPVTKVWPTALHLTNDKRLWSNLRQLPKKSTTAFFLKYDCQESWKVGLSWSKKCKEVVSWWPSAGVLPDHKIQRKPKHSEISHLQICHQTAERTIRKSKRKTK